MDQQLWQPSAEWINSRDNPVERLSFHGKEECRIGHNITGCLICPIDYDWDDPEWVTHAVQVSDFFCLILLCSIHTKLHDAALGYNITSSFFLCCLYAGEDGDPEQPLEGFLKGPLLVQVSFRSISASNNCWHYFIRHSSTYLHPPSLLLHQQKGTLLAMPYRISTLQMPCHINSKYIRGD